MKESKISQLAPGIRYLQTLALKHRHQEVITKVDETVTRKFIYGQVVVL